MYSSFTDQFSNRVKMVVTNVEEAQGGQDRQYIGEARFESKC